MKKSIMFSALAVVMLSAATTSPVAAHYGDFGQDVFQEQKLLRSAPMSIAALNNEQDQFVGARNIFRQEMSGKKTVKIYRDQ